MQTKLITRAQAIAGAAAIAGALLAVEATPAAAQNTPSQSAISANWSGYVVGGSSNSSGQSYSSVSGSWTQPTADCSSGSGDGSFWVGLGGAGQQSNALEQVGTEVDCGSDGTSSSYAWYELVPSAPVRLDLTISPGDRISGKVDVSGSTVTVSLADNTTGGSATKTLTMNNPDVSSAEWIAEAPSSCDGSGNCQPLTLANFGKVSFTGASATANGHTGTISDQSWASEPISLNSAAGANGVPEYLSAQTSGSGDAEPSNLSADGSSFTVSYLSPADQSSAGAGSGGVGSSDGSSGYGGDDGSGGYGAYGPTGGYGGYGGYGVYGYGGYVGPDAYAAVTGAYSLY